MPAPGPVLTLAGLGRTPSSAFVPPEALLRLWCDAVHVVVQRHLLPGLGDRQHDLLYARALVRFVCRERGENARLTPPARRPRLRQPTGKRRRRRRAARTRHAQAVRACATRALSATASPALVRSKSQKPYAAGLLRYATLTMRASHTPMQSASGATCADPTSCAWAARPAARPAIPATPTTARRVFVRSDIPGSVHGTPISPGRRRRFPCAKTHPARIVRVVTVQQSTPSSSGCRGTQVYSASSALTCNAACTLGPTSSSANCGTSLGVPTYCCYRPTFLWTANANPSANPLNANIQAYPFFSLPVVVCCGCRRPPNGSHRQRSQQSLPEPAYTL